MRRGTKPTWIVTPQVAKMLKESGLWDSKLHICGGGRLPTCPHVCAERCKKK